MVVEKAAAEFISGRVLAVGESSLKIQTTDDGEPVVVARSDVYRLPPEPHDFKPGDAAVCSDRPQHWVGCRVLGAEAGNAIRVRLPSGIEGRVERQQIVLPGPVTTLNVQHLFDVLDARQTFRAAARTAGDPSAPSGWLPEPQEPVLAERGGEWFSAHMVGAGEDGGVRVQLSGEDRPEALGRHRIVPVPPFQHVFVAGDFALTRPGAASQAWERVRIEAVGPDEAVVVGDDGQRRRVGVRELAPLGRQPGSPGEPRPGRARKRE